MQQSKVEIQSKEKQTKDLNRSKKAKGLELERSISQEERGLTLHTERQKGITHTKQSSKDMRERETI